MKIKLTVITALVLLGAAILLITGGINVYAPPIGGDASHGTNVSFLGAVGYTFGGTDPGWYRPVPRP